MAGPEAASNVRVLTTVPDKGQNGFYKVRHTTGYNVSTNGVRVVEQPAADGTSAPAIIFEPNVQTNGAYGVQEILHTSNLKAPVTWRSVNSKTNGVPAHVDSVSIGGIERTTDGTHIAVDYTPKITSDS